MGGAETDTSRQRNAQRTAIKKKWILLALGVLAVIVAALAVGYAIQQREIVQGYYEDNSDPNVASFEMRLKYEPDCEDGARCNKDNPSYDFLIFVFNDEGRQVRIVRGNKDGVFKASLPEGEYTLVVSKTFEKISGLPQENIRLQNGKILKLDVDYGKAKSSNNNDKTERTHSI